MYMFDFTFRGAIINFRDVKLILICSVAKSRRT